MQLKIDEEFKNLIPPLTAEEFQQLEANIIKDGCRDALVVWNYTLIDGHNRLKICTDNDISYRTVEKEFADRLEVKQWMLENQLGRRNLNDFCKAEIVLRNTALIGEITEKARENQSGFKGNQYTSAPLNNCSKDQTPINQRKVMADITHTSEGNIQRSKLIIEEGTPEQVNRARNGEAVSKIYKEIKKKGEGTKICNTCHKELHVSEFLENRNECRQCRNDKKQLTGLPSELRNISDEQIIGTLYDTEADIEFTVEDLAEEMQINYNSFEKIFKNCLNMHSDILTDSDSKDAIRNIFVTIKTNLRKMEEEYL